MRRLYPLALLLLASASAAPAPPLCRVQATSTPVATGRLLTVTVTPDCPAGGYARVRLASSLGGSLPDDPPGAWTLRPGLTLVRVSHSWWQLEWLSASGKPYVVREVHR